MKIKKLLHKISKRFRIKDLRFKISHFKIIRKVRHSRLARMINDYRLKIKDKRMGKKLGHLRVGKKVGQHKKLSFGLVPLLIIIPILVGTAAYIQQQNNKKFATGLPFNEKIADGVYVKRNQDPEHYNFGENKSKSKLDLNLKMVVNINDASADGGGGDIAKLFDTLRYKWVVTLSNGTNFEFGGVNKDTPEGKVLPVVRVRNTDGAYVAYAPRLPITDKGLQINENEERSNQKSSIANQYVVPKVKGNVISWEIADGITARYTMQEDRVKADYIVNDQKSINSNQLTFDFQYSEGSELVQELDGQITLQSGGDEAFRIPLPLATESKSEAPSTKSETNSNDSIDAKALVDMQNSNNETGKSWNGSYSLSENSNRKAVVSIILPTDKLAKAQFPLMVDPVIIDSSATSTGTAYGNSRKLIRDAWGNLIAVFDGGTGNDNVWYKNYNSPIWTDAAIDLDGGGGSAQKLQLQISIVMVIFM